MGRDDVYNREGEGLTRRVSYRVDKRKLTVRSEFVSLRPPVLPVTTGVDLYKR